MNILLKPTIAGALVFALLAPAMPTSIAQSGTPSQAQPPLSIARAGSQVSSAGPAENFTGGVRVDPLFRAIGPAAAAGAYVTFEPGARTAWHSHPNGQVLIVTAGVGRVQVWGGPIEEIRPGDVVRVAPGQKHWHGAAPTTGMTHIAIGEHQDGKTVDWLEKVSDTEYLKQP